VIWREITGERVRYHARSVVPEARLHAVVTADLGELRTLLHAGAGGHTMAGQW
jgi:hypothetical protein